MVKKIQVRFPDSGRNDVIRPHILKSNQGLSILETQVAASALTPPRGLDVLWSPRSKKKFRRKCSTKGCPTELSYRNRTISVLEANKNKGEYKGLPLVILQPEILGFI